MPTYQLTNLENIKYDKQRDKKIRDGIVGSSR